MEGDSKDLKRMEKKRKEILKVYAAEVTTIDIVKFHSQIVLFYFLPFIHKSRLKITEILNGS